MPTTHPFLKPSATRRKLTAAQHEAATIAEGQRMIQRKLGADRALKLYGIPLPAKSPPMASKLVAAISDIADRAVARHFAKVTPPATRKTRKAYSTPVEVGPLRRHAYGFRGGLFGT